MQGSWAGVAPAASLLPGSPLAVGGGCTHTPACARGAELLGEGCCWKLELGSTRVRRESGGGAAVAASSLTSPDCAGDKSFYICSWRQCGSSYLFIYFPIVSDTASASN